MRFQFKISGPFGQKKIKAVASLQPLNNMQITEEDIFKNLRETNDINGNNIITRSVQIVPLE